MDEWIPVLELFHSIVLSPEKNEALLQATAWMNLESTEPDASNRSEKAMG